MKFRKFFGYAGGQRALLPLLLELLPHHKTYLELFAGGLTLMLNKQPSDVEIANDLNKNLVNLYSVLINSKKEFERQVSILPNSRELFSKFKKDIIMETDAVKKAVMYFYLIQNTWSGRTSENSTYVAKPVSFNKDVEWFASRMKRVIIENLDFEEAFKKYDSPTTFTFMDPPYADIKNLYAYSFTDEQHVKLARLLRESQGMWLLTYNKHPLIELLYRDFFSFIYETPLTMSGKALTEKHIIVANYDIVNRNFKKFQAKYFEL